MFEMSDALPNMILWILFPFLFVFKDCQGTVNLTHNDLICGQTAILTCKVDPLNAIRWTNPPIVLSNCFTSGSCMSPAFGDYVFTMDTTSSLSTVTISPFNYSTYQNSTYTCSSASVSATVTLDISVPLTNVTMTENQVGNSTELIASTNCVKTSGGLSFAWSCVSAGDGTTPITAYCDVSNITSSENTTGCSSGDNCMGIGLASHRTILTVKNYTGSDSIQVKFALMTTYGSTVLNTTSVSTFAIKAPATTVEPTTAAERHGEKKDRCFCIGWKKFFICITIPIIGGIIVICIIINICWLCKCCCDCCYNCSGSTGCCNCYIACLKCCFNLFCTKKKTFKEEYGIEAIPCSSRVNGDGPLNRGDCTREGEGHDIRNHTSKM